MLARMPTFDDEPEGMRGAVTIFAMVQTVAAGTDERLKASAQRLVKKWASKDPNKGLLEAAEGGDATEMRRLLEEESANPLCSKTGWPLLSEKEISAHLYHVDKSGAVLPGPSCMPHLSMMRTRLALTESASLALHLRDHSKGTQEQLPQNSSGRPYVGPRIWDPVSGTP